MFAASTFDKLVDEAKKHVHEKIDAPPNIKSLGDKIHSIVSCSVVIYEWQVPIYDSSGGTFKPKPIRLQVK